MNHQRVGYVVRAAVLLLGVATWQAFMFADEAAPTAPASDSAAKSTVSTAAPAPAPAAAAAAPAVKLDRRTKNILGTLAAAGEMPNEVRDPAFDHYVDLALVGTAWADLDASLMADVALQLIEGERVLLRPHRVINTDELLKISLRMATVKHDAATLGRLEAAIKPRGNAALLAQVSEAQKTLASAKPEAAIAAVPIDVLTPDTFNFYKGCLKDIDAAVVAEDSAALARIEKELAEFTSLPAECLTKLQDKISAAKPQIGGGEQPVVKTAGILDKLAGATRNPFANSLPAGSAFLSSGVPGGGETPTVPGTPDGPPPDGPPPDGPPPDGPPPDGPPPDGPPPDGPPPDWPPPDGPPPDWPPPDGPPPHWPPPDGPPSYNPPSWRPPYPPQQQQQQQWIPSKTGKPSYTPPSKYSPPSKYTPPSKYPSAQRLPYYPYYPYPQPNYGSPGGSGSGYPRRYSSGW